MTSKYPRILLALFSVSSLSWASSGETRRLDDIYSSADIVFSGTLVAAEIKTCASNESTGMAYLFRGVRLLSGSRAPGDIEVCGPVIPLIMSYQYIIAGNVSDEGGVSVAADGAVLVSTNNEFFRVISYDSLQVSSDRGRAYAIAIEEKDFFDRYASRLNLGGLH